MGQYGGTQTNSISYTVITSQGFGHRIITFQEENVGTTFIYLKLFISKRTPFTRKTDNPPLPSQFGKFRESPVKSEAPWGPAHGRRCSKDLDGQSTQPSLLLLSCPGPLSFRCRRHQDVPWHSVLSPAPRSLMFFSTILCSY